MVSEENAKQLLHELVKSISTLIFGSFEEVGEVTFEDKETEENPRAKSAKLRVFEKAEQQD